MNSTNFITFDLSKVQDLSAAFSGLRDEIYLVMFILCLIGYFSRIWQNRKEPQAHLMTIGSISLIIVLASPPAIAFWRPLLYSIFYYPAEKLASSSTVFQINEAMNAFSAIQQDAQRNGPSISWNLLSLTRYGIQSIFFYGLYIILCQIAAIVVVPFLFLQRCIVEFGFAFCPIAFGALTVPKLTDRGAGFLAMTASFLAWPLGFAIVAAMANIALSAWPAAGNGGAVIGPLVSAIVAALILIVGSIMVPSTCLYIFLYGGTVFNPISAAASGIPFVGRVFSFRGR